MDLDSAYLGVFVFREVATDLMRELVPDKWGKRIEPGRARLETLPTRRVFDERQNAALWHVTFPGERGGTARVMLQIESENDWGAPVTVAARVTSLMLVQAQERPGKKIELVVAVVLYHGKRRWMAVDDLREIIGDDPRVSLWRTQPSVPYLVVEEHFCSMLDRPQDNFAVLMVAAARARSCKELLKIVRRLSATVQERAEGNLDLQRALVNWLKVVVLSVRAPNIELPATETLDDLVQSVEEQVTPWLEAAKQTALKRSRNAGRLQGMRRALRYLARNRYGDEFATKLAAFLAGVDSPDLLKRIGCLISDSKTSDGLMDEIRRLWMPSFSVEDLPDLSVQ